MIRKALIAMSLALLSTAANAAPPARLADLDWIVGTWEGPGVEGAPSIEAWSPAAAGQIPGHFRQLKPDGGVMFYEFFALAEKEGNLVLRLKHFNADLTGWEEKAVVREFPLTKVAKNLWEFSGITYIREGRSRMTVEVLIRNADKSQEKLVFKLRRR